MHSHYLRIPMEDALDSSDTFDPVACVVRLCPACKKSRSVKLDEGDPPSTKRIEMTCIRCQTGSETPKFFDAAGDQIPFP